MLDREPGRDIVDTALVIASRRHAPVVEHHASRRRVGGRDDGDRGQRAILDIAGQTLEVDQRRDGLRLRAGVQQARRAGTPMPSNSSPVQQHTGELAR